MQLMSNDWIDNAFTKTENLAKDKQRFPKRIIENEGPNNMNPTI